jgi:hypothetical protein
MTRRTIRVRLTDDIFVGGALSLGMLLGYFWSVIPSPLGVIAAVLIAVSALRFKITITEEEFVDDDD